MAAIFETKRSGRKKKITKEQENILIDKVVNESPMSLKKVMADFTKIHPIELSLSTQPCKGDSK